MTTGGIDFLINIDTTPDLFDRERLAAFASDADIARLSWHCHGTGVNEPLIIRRPVYVNFANISVDLPQGAFLQPSFEGEQVLTGLVLEGVAGAKRIADLFAGCGTFSFPLASLAQVHAIEGASKACDILKAASDRAGSNIKVTWRDLMKAPLQGIELQNFDVLVFNPPRAGARKVVEAIAVERQPERIVAVSCSPATLARDLHILISNGYDLEKITPIDQFPWSSHIEAVALLSYRG